MSVCILAKEVAHSFELEFVSFFLTVASLASFTNGSQPESAEEKHF